MAPRMARSPLTGTRYWQLDRTLFSRSRQLHNIQFSISVHVILGSNGSIARDDVRLKSKEDRLAGIPLTDLPLVSGAFKARNRDNLQIFSHS